MRYTAYALIAGMLPGLALAQQDAGAWGSQQGDTTFVLAGSGANDDGFDNGSFGLSASVGRYVTPNLEVSLRQGLNWAEVNNDSSTAASTRLAADYNFPLGRWEPFLGANIGYIYGGAVNNTGIAGPEAGLKYYLKPDTYAYLQTEWQYYFDSGNDLTDNFSDGSYAHTVGIGVTF